MVRANENENDSKIYKIEKMAKSYFSRFDFGSWGGFLAGFGAEFVIEKWSYFDSGTQNAIFGSP